MAITIQQVDFDDAAQRQSLIGMIDHYARHEMGMSRPLDDEVKTRLDTDLAAHPTALAFLAIDSADNGGQAVGYALCFLGFSSFAARPLINVHDLAVHGEHRGKGIGRALLEAVAGHAEAIGCCKVTLEVREDNAVAEGLYRKLGFTDDSGEVRQLFLTKRL